MPHRSNHSVDMNTNFSPSKQSSQSSNGGAAEFSDNTESTPKQNPDVVMAQDAPSVVERLHRYTVTSSVESGIAEPSSALEATCAQRPVNMFQTNNPVEVRPSEGTVLNDIYGILDRELGSVAAECFKNAPIQPPITRDSLSELSTSRIMNNPKLRHDVNFDRELQFRPNVDGSKGKEKKKTAGQYWLAVRGELHMYARVQAAFLQPTSDTQSTVYLLAVRQLSRKRLPTLFYALCEILKTLVPDCDHHVIVDTLDVPLLMQQIDNGVCDLPALAEWFANVLKKHCAPMRDGLVDKMRDQMCAGATEADMGKVSEGLRQLLNVLELMKLDVANHQIRHMRPFLVDDAVGFQIRYHAQRVAQGKINLAKCHAWFHEARCSYAEQLSKHTEIQTLCGLVFRGLLFRDNLTFLPPLFHLDWERLQGIRLELRRIVFIDICAMVFEEVVGVGAEEPAKKVAAGELCSTISKLLGSSHKFSDSLENVSAEIMRSVFKVENRDEKFDSQLLNFIEFRLEAETKPESCFYEYAASAACQRFLPQLSGYVTALSSVPAQTLQNMLVPLPAQATFRQYAGFAAQDTSSSSSSSFLLPLQALSNTPNASPLPLLNDLEQDLLNRMTHMLVLHWQVWREAVYQSPLLPPMPTFLRPYTPVPSSDDDDNDDEHDEEDDSDGCDTPPSDKVDSAVSGLLSADAAKNLSVQVVANALPTPSPSPPLPAVEAQGKILVVTEMAMEENGATESSVDAETLTLPDSHAAGEDNEML